ncbi:MAG: hypothetical protein WD534_05070 [Phycisphaeraceae bacterium]
MSDDRLVTEELLNVVRGECGSRSLREQLEELESIEPELKNWVARRTCHVTLLLDASGISSELVSQVDEEMEWMAVVLIEALRRAHYELWMEMAIGSRIEQLDPELSKRVRKRKKRGR